MLAEQRFPLVEKSRRIGGTTSALVRVQELLRSKQEMIWRWCEPWKYQAREIVIPEMNRIQETCPESLKFKYYRTDSFYELATNGSRIYLRGVNEDCGESSRGAFAHGITADEFGSWKDAKYIKNDVLLPQLLSTNGPLWEISSPPPDLGHVYYEEKERAMREKRYVLKTILDAVPDLYAQEQIDEMCKEVGGVTSTAWRREFLCEECSDDAMLIVPEYDDKLNVVPDDYPRPQYFTSYVGGDSGADDNTAVLFGYYDFAKDEIVIEDENINAGKTTEEIVTQAKAKEKELWTIAIDPDGKPVINHPHIRAYDAPKQLIYDIFVTHKWPVRMPQKDDKHAAIHSLRVAVGARKIKIKEKCKHLRRQLRVGIWKNEQHLDFQRNEGLGHLDAIAALIYFNRSVDTKINPIPPYLGLSHETHFIPPGQSLPTGSPEAEIASALGFRRS